MPLRATRGAAGGIALRDPRLRSRLTSPPAPVELRWPYRQDKAPRMTKMQGPSLCALGIAILAASLAISDQRGSKRRDRLSLVMAAMAGTLVAVGFAYIASAG
jgi:hypothetical protein